MVKRKRRTKPDPVANMDALMADVEHLLNSRIAEFLSDESPRSRCSWPTELTVTIPIQCPESEYKDPRFERIKYDPETGDTWDAFDNYLGKGQLHEDGRFTITPQFDEIEKTNLQS